MLFNSLEYAVFLTLAVILYYLIYRHQYRWIVLLVASIIFYAYADPALLAIPLAITCISYWGGLQIVRQKNQKARKVFFVSSLIAILAILIFFKYFNFLNETITNLFQLAGLRNPVPYLKILAPLGISYITFQAIGYLIEIYLGRYPAEPSLPLFATYLLFFPKLIAGPVERAHLFIPQLKVKHSFNYDNLTEGLRLIGWGTFKKLVVADRLAVIVDQVFNNPAGFPGPSFIIAAVFFTIQVYADFSGYTDMARGAGRLMGFQLMENFNLPFLASSTTELWRRWHMSLSTWFKEYVFTPLSVAKRNWGLWGVIYASIITFILLGFWHGATWGFIVFGLLQGIMLAMELLTMPAKKKLGRKIPRLLTRIAGVLFTFTFFSVALVFIRANSVSDAFYMISHMGQGFGEIISGWKSISQTLRIQFGAGKIDWVILAGVVLFMETLHLLQPKYGTLLRKTPVYIRWPLYYTIGLSIVLLGIFNETQFIYFKF